MSKHGALNLHSREEAVTIDLASLLQPMPSRVPPSPITEYFETTDELKKKILAPDVSDAEMFGLLTIGVISSVEFYLRNVFGRVPEICSIARRHFELTGVPAGAFAFYANSPLPPLLAIFDHESLADGKKINNAAQKIANINLNDDSSVKKVIEDFDRLCELRHCLVHSRGFVGLKACSILGLNFRHPHKVLMTRQHVLEVLKIAHNVVRAVNRCLADSIANRWVDQGLLTGQWQSDKVLFSNLFNTFVLKGNDAYSGNIYRAYLPFRKAARIRAQASLANA